MKKFCPRKKKNCPRKFLKFCPRNKKSHPEKKYENVSEKTLDCLRKKIKIVGEKENSAREKKLKKVPKTVFSGKKINTALNQSAKNLTNGNPNLLTFTTEKKNLIENKLFS